MSSMGNNHKHLFITLLPTSDAINFIWTSTMIKATRDVKGIRADWWGPVHYVMSFVREPLFSRPSNNAFWEVLPHQSIIAIWKFALDEIIGVSGKLFGIRRSNLNSTSEPETVLDPISVVLVTVQYYFWSAIRPLSTLIISIYITSRADLPLVKYLSIHTRHDVRCCSCLNCVADVPLKEDVFITKRHSSDCKRTFSITF